MMASSSASDIEDGSPWSMFVRSTELKLGKALFSKISADLTCDGVISMGFPDLSRNLPIALS